MSTPFDLAVIGGGINGAGIAADASMRGLSVILIEKDDFAAHTSSSSTKLIHGGLRYLELYDFLLVRKALNERQTLLQIAPHLVFPKPFILPYQPGIRSFWLLRLGLLIYDHLSFKNRLPKSASINRKTSSDYFSPLSDELNKGFLFYDCCTDDARLTIANVLQAKEHGAICLPQTILTKASIQNRLWQLTLKDNESQKINTIHAKTLINATGPWVEKTNALLGIPSEYHISLVKGSHLVVSKLYKGNHAYLLQHDDKRIVFVIPYHDGTMIGTTDLVAHDPNETLSITNEEIEYLFGLVQEYFKYKLTQNDIITSWSGLRPLLSTNDKLPQSISRDYTYHFSSTPAPAVTIYGGKITTYRQLARDAVDSLNTVFPNLPNSTTLNTPLPGGQHFETYRKEASVRYPFIDSSLLDRLLHTYGDRTENILKGCHCMEDLGEHYGQDLYQCEVDYLIKEEWARKVDDILWRRTKLGLKLTPKTVKALEKYLRIKNINGHSH